MKMISASAKRSPDLEVLRISEQDPIAGDWREGKVR